MFLSLKKFSILPFTSQSFIIPKFKILTKILILTYPFLLHFPLFPNHPSSPQPLSLPFLSKKTTHNLLIHNPKIQLLQPITSQLHNKKNTPNPFSKPTIKKILLTALHSKNSQNFFNFPSLTLLP
jgi:hypothetical protein